jgi:hypothetical protein
VKGVDVTDPTCEQWLPIGGYESRYEVSNLGRIRSLPKGNILKPHPRGRYQGVSLSLNGAVRGAYIHHLVALAFLGQRPDGYDICHEDGDRANNCADNLRYDTHSANMRDSLQHGTHRSTAVTHCPRGHEYTPSNSMLHVTRAPDGGAKSHRSCRECHRLRNETRNRRLAAEKRRAV